MPVKIAMKTAMGTESTPRRRIWTARSGAQVETSARARPASRLRRPTSVMNPSRTKKRTPGNLDEGRKLGKVTELRWDLASPPSGCVAEGSCGEGGQGSPHFPIAQTLQRPVPELPHPFAGDTKQAANFFQGMLPAVVQPEVQPQNLGITWWESFQGPVDLFGEKLVHHEGFRRSRLIRHKPVAERAFSLSFDRSIEAHISRIE